MEIKPDFDRLGFFQELGYISIGDPYQSSIRPPYRSAFHGRQMMSQGSKSNDHNEDGYFRKPFTRIMEEEALCDLVKLVRRYRNERIEKRLDKYWHNKGYKWPCGKGSYCGTICRPYLSFSPVTRDEPPVRTGLKNFLPSCTKRGTGYGYVKVTMNKYPEWMKNEYNIFKMKLQKELKAEKFELKKRGIYHNAFYPQPYFGPDPYKFSGKLKKKKKPAPEPPRKKKAPFYPSSPPKRDGGMKAGTLNTFPPYDSGLYSNLCFYPREVRNKSDKTYYPSGVPKSTVQSSIIAKNVLKQINSTNFRSVRQVMNIRNPCMR